MKNRRILFTGLFPYWSYHFTAELNLVEEALAAGSDVYLLACDENLQTCECNYLHDEAICSQCVSVRKEGVRRLSAPVTVLPLIRREYQQWPGPQAMGPFSSVEELQAYRFEGFDAGMAAFSSLVDRSQSTSPDVVGMDPVITRLLVDGCRVYRSALDYLNEYAFDEVAIFNGRFSAARPWVRACQAKGIPFYTHERTGNPKRILKYPGSFPHDPTQYAPLVKAHREASQTDPAYRAEGEEFFLERPKGKLSSWWSFVGQQTPDTLPEGFDGSRKNVAIFSTTDFEIVATSDLYVHTTFRGQARTILRLVSGVREKDPGCFFYLRVHPNAAMGKDRWWESEAFRSAPNLVVIPPESQLSSYALLGACTLVVAWGSNMGVEATFWGKPSILLGPAFYAGIDAVYEPASMEDAIDLIVDVPPPKDRENAVAYGAFLMTGGIKLPFSEAINHYQLTFKGTGLWETTPDPVPVPEAAQGLEVTQNLAPCGEKGGEVRFPKKGLLVRLGDALRSRILPK